MLWIRTKYGEIIENAIPRIVDGRYDGFEVPGSKYTFKYEVCTVLSKEEIEAIQKLRMKEHLEEASGKVQVVKPPKFKIATCNKCGAELKYTEKSLRKEQSHMNEYQYYLTCPCCSNEFCVGCS